MFADALDLPIEVPAATEIAALGAAICAGIGVMGIPATPMPWPVPQIVRRHEPQAEATPKYRTL